MTQNLEGVGVIAQCKAHGFKPETHTHRVICSRLCFPPKSQNFPIPWKAVLTWLLHVVMKFLTTKYMVRNARSLWRGLARHLQGTICYKERALVV